ncbi:toprim domain-containing protein [Asticcacaulis sp. YBE204]|uniref:DUF7146 domain-containing protein n=1 Tax=Asticcacaulis sp. YBE204 TaxID=1282363 RepID=UPI001F303661|nr:toprim domain-containing protein [Asticcacaulis sp. YBE204]
MSLLIGRTGRVIVHSFGGATVREILADLEASGLIDAQGFPLNGPSARTAPSQPLAPRARRERAAALWRQTIPLKGALSADYLKQHRAINRPADQIGALRHHPACPLSAYDPRCRRTRPALVACLNDADGRLTAVELTYLTDTGRRDFTLRTSRKLIGTVPAGSGVALDAAAPHMLVGEGVMTVLSACERYALPGHACLSAHNLSTFQPHTEMRSLVIAADRGPAGESAAAILSARLRSAGLLVDVRLPPEPYDDFNSWAQAEAREKGRAGVGDV